MKHLKLSTEQKLTAQMLLGFVLAIVGVVLIFLSLYMPPIGIIDTSVLTAIGECFTFSGGLIGIDYSYRFKAFKIDEDYRHKRMMFEERKEFEDEE